VPQAQGSGVAAELWTLSVLADYVALAEVLMVYRDVNLYCAEAVHDQRITPIYTVSVDEKPGVQALGTTAPDLPPVPSKHAGVGRDHEYVRHGTLSILAALDLYTGQIIANVEPRHRSREFIGLLQRLHEHHPAEAVIRVVLDNHSAHISRETMACWPGTRGASSTSIPPSTDRGSISLSPPSPRWLALFCDISESLPSTNSNSAFSKESMK